MSTTVWHQGKSRTFSNEAEAFAYIKGIDMARDKRRNSEPKLELTPTEAPQVCDDSCGLSTGADNKGGFYVTHRSRGGNLITGTFQHGEDSSAWLEKIHAEES